MKRDQRLRRPAEFQRVRQQAPRAWTHSLVVLYAAPNQLDRARVGVTVSKRVGNAVVRNRVRRRIREAVRLRQPEILPGFDLVLVGRAGVTRCTWGELCEGVQQVLSRAGLAVP